MCLTCFEFYCCYLFVFFIVLVVYCALFVSFICSYCFIVLVVYLFIVYCALLTHAHHHVGFAAKVGTANPRRWGKCRSDDSYVSKTAICRVTPVL